MKIHPVESELFHADGRTDEDKTKLIITSRNFTKAPKMQFVPIKNTAHPLLKPVGYSCLGK